MVFFRKEVNDFTVKPLAGRMIMLGSNFLAGIAVLGYIGYLIDKKQGTAPWYMGAGCFLGVLYGLYESVKVALALMREQESSETSNLKNENDQ